MNNNVTELQELYTNFQYKIDRNFNKPINHIDEHIYLRRYVEWSTMLMIATYHGLYDIVERCLKLGADVNKTDSNGVNALHLAFGYRYREIAELLLKSGADPNTNVKHDDDNKKIPILFYLSSYSYYSKEDIILLIKYGSLTNQFHKYKSYLHKNIYLYFINIIAKRRWVYIKCVTKFLSIHKRAVVTANHPDRLKLQGTFEQLEI